MADTPVVPPTTEAEITGSQSEANPGKSTSTYLKNKLKAKSNRGIAQIGRAIA
jgi:hypothetical protein